MCTVLGDTLLVMGVLSQLGYSGFKYLEPERLDPTEARRRRVQSELDRTRKVMESWDARRLSPANQFHLNQLKEFEVKLSDELEARRRRVVDLERKGDYRRLKSARSVLFHLTQRHALLRKRAASEQRANELRSLYQASAADRRFYNPSVIRNPRNVYGTEALVHAYAHTKYRYRHAHLSIPCIRRAVRKEVMFATRKAGRAYRKPHRFNALSLIGC